MEKIVITGTGAISSIGLGTEENWNSMLNSVSGVGPITLFNAEDFLVKIACEVKGFDPSEHIPGRSSRRRDRFQQFSSVAVTEAIENPLIPELTITGANNLLVNVTGNSQLKYFEVQSTGSRFL